MNPIVTTERTGKDVKLQLLLSGLMLAFGLVLWLGAGSPWGVLMFLVGGIWYFCVKIIRWWRYG